MPENWTAGISVAMAVPKMAAIWLFSSEETSNPRPVAQSTRYGGLEFGYFAEGAQYRCGHSEREPGELSPPTFVVTDGSSPINLFNTASGMVNTPAAAS